LCVRAEALAQLSNVSKSYRIVDQTIAALRQANLAVAAGDVTAPSGSGKCTLATVIGGLDRPGSAAVMANGKDLPKTTTGLPRLGGHVTWLATPARGRSRLGTEVAGRRVAPIAGRPRCVRSGGHMQATGRRVDNHITSRFLVRGRADQAPGGHLRPLEVRVDGARAAGPAAGLAPPGEERDSQAAAENLADYIKSCLGA
jgi:energy-coupling factor transporter ATP-binding protein EcfA2